MNIPRVGPASLVYACRRCHREFPGAHGQDGSGMLQGIVSTLNQIGPVAGIATEKPFVMAHLCDDGRVGIGDVSGIDPDPAVS